MSLSSRLVSKILLCLYLCHYFDKVFEIILEYWIGWFYTSDVYNQYQIVNDAMFYSSGNKDSGKYFLLVITNSGDYITIIDMRIYKPVAKGTWSAHL